jgi:hypothetical protein
MNMPYNSIIAYIADRIQKLFLNLLLNISYFELLVKQFRKYYFNITVNPLRFDFGLNLGSLKLNTAKSIPPIWKKIA